MRFKLLLLFSFLPLINFAGTMGRQLENHFYFGGNLGAAWGLLNNQLSIYNNPANPLFYAPSIAGVNYSGSNNFNPLRFIIGFQTGYNYDFKSLYLLGIELGYNFINLTETIHKYDSYNNNTIKRYYTFESSAAAKQFVTLRPRIGYHYGQYLPYVTAGGSYINLNFKQNFTDLNYNISNLNNYKKNCFGWNVGAGIEYFPLKKISFKLEYLYNNFGNIAVNSNFLGTGLLSSESAIMHNSLKNIYVQTFILGLNFHLA